MTTTQIPEQMTVDTKMFNDLVAERKKLIGLLQLAVKYLDHPDVQSIPFVVSAKVVAERVHNAIDKPE